MWAKFYEVGFDLAIKFCETTVTQFGLGSFYGQTISEVRLKSVDKGLVDQLLNRTGISDMSLWMHC